jgi:hypothetical protein
MNHRRGVAVGLGISGLVLVRSDRWERPQKSRGGDSMVASITKSCQGEDRGIGRHGGTPRSWHRGLMFHYKCLSGKHLSWTGTLERLRRTRTRPTVKKHSVQSL